MGFVLFGHSFVRRLKSKRGSIVSIDLERNSIPINCLGEGGLNFTRIQAKPNEYFSQLRGVQPSVLILDLGTNDLCAPKGNPSAVFYQYGVFLKDLRRWGVAPDIIVFLPVLPRTGTLRGGQVSLDEFNRRAEEFNKLLVEESWREDKWWVWNHRGLKHPRYNLDGVHLNASGMIQYERTLKQVVKFFDSRCW